MDVSLEYIAMCKAAEEIQALRPQPKDPPYSEECDWDYTAFFYLPHEERVEVLKWDNDERRPIIGGYHDDAHEAIWLPRLDQLQEIAGDVDSFTEHMAYHPGPYAAASSKRWAVWNKQQDKWWDTVEQAWLAFIMEQNYQKLWDGKAWIAA